MSDGMRSGVNWMRLASRPSTRPSVSTSSVLARPGTPMSSAWPPERMVISVRSMTTSWPKMTDGGGFVGALHPFGRRFQARNDGFVSLNHGAHEDFCPDRELLGAR